MGKTIYQTIGPAILAPYIGVSPQRASVMIANPERGDNEQRLRAALRALWVDIGREIGCVVDYD